MLYTETFTPGFQQLIYLSGLVLNQAYSPLRLNMFYSVYSVYTVYVFSCFTCYTVLHRALFATTLFGTALITKEAPL